MRVRIFWGTSILIATCVVTVFATTTFGAPFNDLFGRDWRRLSGKDMQLLQRTVREVLEMRFPGASANWEDPNTGEAGRASVLRTYERDGMPCAEVEYVFTTGNRYRYVLPFCRKDGEWKLAFWESMPRTGSTSAKRARARSATAILGTMGFAATTQPRRSLQMSRRGARTLSRRSQRQIESAAAPDRPGAR